MGRPINNIRKANIRVKINKAGYRKLIQLANTVVLNLTGNLNFATPIPSLVDVNTGSTNLKNAAAFMGLKRNRGSKADLAAANEAAVALRSLLTSLKQYCINTAVTASPTDTPTQAALLASTGFGFAVTRAITPRSQAATFVRQTNNHRFPGTVGRINWKRPIGLIKGKRVQSYDIYEIPAVPGPDVYLMTVTKCNAVIAPAAGTNMNLRIVPKNSRGAGNAILTTVKGLS
jgi:hypothetical protein